MCREVWSVVAVLSNRLTERIKIPVPPLMLAGAAVAATLIATLHAPAEKTVERLSTPRQLCQRGPLP